MKATLLKNLQPGKDGKLMQTPLLRSVTLALLLVWLIGCPAAGYAQDASQVVRLSVSFRTIKNSVQADEATRKTVEDLEAKARAASNAQKFGEAVKHYSHGIALLRKQEWTPWRAFDTALQVKAERLIFDPGDVARVRLSQSFALDQPLPGKLALTLALAQTREGKRETLKELKTLKDLPADFSKELALDIALPLITDGNYQLLLTLTLAAGEPISKPLTIRIERELNAKANLLKARVLTVKNDLEQRPQDPTQPSLLRAVPRAEFASSLIDMVNSGAVSLDRVDWQSEFTSAHAMLDQIIKEQNPLRALRGDVHWAYTSALDNTVQPYRLYIPTKYNARQKWPLVVVLHGMGGDENSFFAGYARGSIKEIAETRGYLLVCPKGRGPTSMYLGAAERDVLDVLNEVKRDFNIDENRVYLMGHSMGGYGTWSLAVNHPELFAALAPLAGGGMPQVVAGLKMIAHIPWLVVHGDKDPTVPVEESRKMVKAGRELGIEIKYNEVPGGNHGNIVVPAFKEIFDWFDAHKRQPKAAAKAAGSGQ
jgi:predicted esterase